MPAVKVGFNGYTATDRARDFLGCFGDDRGRRVLAQISNICERHVMPQQANEHGTLAYMAGARWAFMEILRCMNAPTEVTVERSDDERRNNVDS